MGFAFVNGSSVFLTQMLRVPLKGLIKAMKAPSGEICAPEISGSPKNSSRSISGGCCAHTGAASARVMRTESISKPINDRLDRPFERINTSFVEWVLIGLLRMNERLITQ